jgi:hypothetical protein
MKRLVFVALSIFLLTGFAAPASAQMKHDGAKASLQLFEAIVIGTTTLEPGEYRFQCRNIDGKDYLVVTSSNGKEVVRVPCKPENLEGKITQSDYRTVKRNDGTKALASVRIKGESVAHIVVND